MGRKAVRKLVKKAPKLIFTIATSTNQNQTQKNKKNKKNLSYVVNDDVLKLMRKQLADIGCKLHEVKGDGNCLFRALSDQLFGDQQQYQQVREKIVNYLEQHRNDFEPFMEDEEKFEKYCDRMRDNGTWGGNQELYAAARLFQVYIIVHQNQPSARIMVIECDQLKPTRVIHVAYHGEDHYDSVRAITDPVEPDSLPVSIELDCNGFRSEEFAKRWQTQATPVASDEQRVVPKSSIDPADAEVDQIDQLASSLGEQLQIAARTGNDVAKMTLSKKEKRQMRKVAKAASRSARKLQSTLK